MNSTTTKSINIQIEDETIRDLLPGYVARRKEEIVKLQEMVSQDDFTQLRMIGHNLKGSGGLYGLPALSDFGANLESAALAQNQENIQDLLTEMKNYLDLIHIAD